MCNLRTNFFQVCRYSTNLAIYKKTKIIDKGSVWLKCKFLKRLTIFFIFNMPIQLLIKGSSWLEMLLCILNFVSNYFLKIILPRNG